MESNETNPGDNNVVLEEIRNEVSGLKDLFYRRLMNDKQKAELLRSVSDAAQFSVIEPFLHDIFLLLDRIEQQNDEFIGSVRDELLEIINRRGVEKILVTNEFNPELHRAVRKEKSETETAMSVVGIVRNGYSFNGKVIRPADVVVAASNG